MVRCRPWCRLMAYRQVIYDLSVAGREKGDTRLSPQINKRCSGAHITSTLHVCKTTDLALAFFFSELSPGLHILLSSVIFFYSLHISKPFLSASLLIPRYPPTLFQTSPLPLLLSLFCLLSQQGAGDFDMLAIIYRNMM